MMLTVCPSNSPKYQLLKGPLKPWLIENRVPAMYSPTHRGWHVRVEHVPDVLAMAQRDGIPVNLSGTP